MSGKHSTQQYLLLPPCGDDRGAAFRRDGGVRALPAFVQDGSGGAGMQGCPHIPYRLLPSVVFFQPPSICTRTSTLRLYLQPKQPDKDLGTALQQRAAGPRPHSIQNHSTGSAEAAQ